MPRAPLALATLLMLLAPLAAQARDCNRRALELFDISRRSRTILDEVEHAERTYTEAMRRYDEEIPSGPGFLGGAFMFSSQGLGQVPVCAGEVRALSLGRTQWAALARWAHPDGRWGLRFTAVGAGDGLTHTEAETIEDEEGNPTETWVLHPYLTQQQRYIGATVRVPHLELSAGRIDIGGLREGEGDDQLDGAAPTAAEATRYHLRVALPTLDDLAAEMVVGPDLEQLEAALIGLAVPLPHEMVGTARAAWLADESRAVLRLGLTDPWGVLTGDVGFETSEAIFRHARLGGRLLTDALDFKRSDPGDASRWAHFTSTYIRGGIEGEISRFSGRHLEHITGRTGVNGWSLHGLLVVHSTAIPMRIEARFGGGHNTVDLLEHAAALVDRPLLDSRALVSMGW